MPNATAEWSEGEYEVPICSEEVAVKGYYCSNCLGFVILRRKTCPECGLPMLAWDDEKNWK